MKPSSLNGPSPRISGAKRKASIIASAARLFAAKGFTGTKTKVIAEHAGVSEALVFKHFPSKKDLYAAILEDQCPIPSILAELKTFADEQHDVKVFSCIAKSIVRKEPDVQLMRLLLFSALEEHELSDMFFQNHVRVFYDFLSSYIDRRIRDGAFRSVDPLLAARAFMGMLIYHRLLSQLFHLPVKQKSQEIEDTFVSIFLDGLRVGKIPTGMLQDVSPIRSRSSRRKKRV
ncbi:TetR/AcrR family transcriptional regulator [Nitrospira sp. M1]